MKIITAILFIPLFSCESPKITSKGFGIGPTLPDPEEQFLVDCVSLDDSSPFEKMSLAQHSMRLLYRDGVEKVFATFNHAPLLDLAHETYGSPRGIKHVNFSGIHRSENGRPTWVRYSGFIGSTKILRYPLRTGVHFHIEYEGLDTLDPETIEAFKSYDVSEGTFAMACTEL